MTDPQITTPMKKLARDCAEHLAASVCGNGWFSISEMMLDAMADDILIYLNTANLMPRQK